jgi:hypothetical protein
VAKGGRNGGRDGGRERPVKPWANKAVVVVQTRSAQLRRCSDRGADGWAHSVLYFPKLSKLAQAWKLKMDALSSSKNSQFLHVAILGHYEQFYQLCGHPILNRIRV